MAFDGVSSGIAESRESSSTIIRCTIKTIRDDLGSLSRETTNTRDEDGEIIRETKTERYAKWEL